MNQCQVLLISLCMLLTVPGTAQPAMPVSVQFKIAAELPAENGMKQSLGFAGAVAGTNNNLLFIGGGANFPKGMPWQGAPKIYYASLFVYALQKDKMQLLKQSFTLPENIAYAASCSIPEGVLFAGGENEHGLSNKVWLIRWDSAKEQIAFNEFPPLPVAITNAAITSAGHHIYIAGGELSAIASSQLLTLDLRNIQAGWKRLAEIPYPVSHTVMVASLRKGGGQIFLCGGRRKNTNGISELYSNVAVYDIGSNQWKAAAPLPYALSAGTGILYDKDNILIFGGDKGIVFHEVETLISEIQTEKNEEKKQALILKKNGLQITHPGFSKEILLYNIKQNTWTITDTIPFAAPVTTIALKWNSEIIIPTGEIKAGIRSPYILTAHIVQNHQ